MNSDLQESKTVGTPWEVAKKYAEVYKNFPQNFASLVRRAHSFEDSIPNSFTWEVKRLLRSEGMKRSIYRLLCTLYHEDRIGDTIESPNQVLSLLEPKSFTAALCFMYAYKGLKKGIDKKEWDLFMDHRACAFDLAPLIGLSLPGTLPYHGILSLGGRLLGLLALMKAKPEEFKAYRRHLHKQNLFCDPEQEYRFFGCSHVELASTIYIAMGIPGIDSRRAGESMLQEVSEMLYENDPEVYRFAIIMPWYNSIMASKKEPNMKHVGNYYPIASDFDNLRQKTELIMDNLGPFCWMDDSTSEDE